MTRCLSTAFVATAFALSALSAPALSLPLQVPAAGPKAEPATTRSARYRGGAGSTWKPGKNSHGFAGTYGGCSYRGVAGPGGYQLKKSC